MDVRVKAYAKLNLTLGITGARDGYHLIDSLVCTVDCFDLIKLKKRKDKLVSVEMHGRGSEGIPPERNNAQKAAEAYIEAFGTTGADIIIYKNIPVGAGMGGSSADAAGVLRGMSKLYGLGSERRLKELADGLGSDTGYLLSGGYARITGRGEKVESLNSDMRLNFLLLVPKDGVSTAECYKLYDSIGQSTNGSESAIKALTCGDTAGLAENMNNALYAPACRLNGDVYTAFNELKEFSPLGVNMTGSGSGVFAVFESAELCAWAKSRYRGKFESILLKTKREKKVIKWQKKD
ncbi:MAG: 4-(cytidine 5'-diphospho)-2-C-methyl-D-erythritol kinase [Clostridia bacterium]|nr:4-(cytidine 5'-diphospho)-2-C-methyl-D-erythritol kinase [Clostridia bacterium]